jgi:hypothetical protein
MGGTWLPEFFINQGRELSIRPAHQGCSAALA